MARPLRIQFAGALYHVVSKGNERRGIVRDEKDYERRLEWLERTTMRFGWRLHAFTLVRHREHLFVETPQANLSMGMQYLNGSYSGYFNRRHHRRGHLFEGRYKGHLIETQGFFLNVSRYIHRIPVGLELAARPDEYRWSSFHGYRRAAQALDWVCYERVLGELEVSESHTRRAYVKFVNSNDDEAKTSPFDEAAGGLLLGSKEFVERMQQMLADVKEDEALPQLKALRQRPPMKQIIEFVANEFGSDVGRWRSGSREDGVGRAAAAYLARCYFGYPAQEIATALGYRSHGSVRSAISRIEKSSPTTKKQLKQLAERLS